MENFITKIENFRIFHTGLLNGRKKILKINKYVLNLLLTVGYVVLIVNGDALAAEVKHNVLKVRSTLESDLVNLDPAKLTTSQDRTVAQQVFQGLVTFDTTAKPPYPVVPLLAESYEVSKDGKVITFKLRQGVQFHGGYGELTSEDVVFTIQRHLNPKVGSLAKSELEDVERVEAPDKYTVRIYLKISSALTLLQNLAWQNAGSILSKKAVEKLGDKIQSMPIGTGPFYFEKWNVAEKVILRKFPHYWRTPAKIDEVEFWVIPEEIVALGALEKGDLEIVPITQMGSLSRAKMIKNISIVAAKGDIYQYITYINHKMKPMDDLRVRRALAYAMDIKGINARIGELVMPFPSPLPPAVFAATDEFWPYKYDLNKAKQLLAEAGYPKGFELTVIYKRGILYEPIALELQNCWNKIVNVKLELLESATYLNRLKAYKYHITPWGLGRMAPYLFAQAYETGSPRNFSQYSNPEIDAIINKAKTATTVEKAREYWREFQKKANEDVVNLVPAVGRSLAAMSNKVKGVIVMPFSRMVDLERAYIIQ